MQLAHCRHNSKNTIKNHRPTESFRLSGDFRGYFLAVSGWARVGSRSRGTEMTPRVSRCIGRNLEGENAFEFGPARLQIESTGLRRWNAPLTPEPGVPASECRLDK
jgi:hypothetical protein